MPAGGATRCAADYQARISGPLLDRIDISDRSAGARCRRPRAPGGVGGKRRGCAPASPPPGRCRASATRRSNIRARAPMPIATEACSKISPLPTTRGGHSCRRRARLERAGLSPHSSCGAHPCRSRRRGWGRPHPYCRGLELSRRDVAPRASRSLKFFSEPQYLGTSLGSVCNIPKLSHSIRIGLLTGTCCGQIGAAALLVASVAGSVARPPHFTASLAETWH